MGASSTRAASRVKREGRPGALDLAGCLWHPGRVRPGPVARALLLAAVAIAAIGGSGCAGAGHREAWSRSVEVTATGRASVKPDIAVAMLGAERQAATVAEATADVAARMSAVLARLRALGVQDADITTVAYQVHPIVVQRREDEPPRITYQATNLVRVKVRALEGIGRLLDDAVAAGANAVRDVQFTLADPSAAEARARADAVREATARAEQLAAAAGRKLGKLMWLSEGRADQPGPRPMALSARASMAPGPVESGQLEITVTVQARWRLAR